MPEVVGRPGLALIAWARLRHAVLGWDIEAGSRSASDLAQRRAGAHPRLGDSPPGQQCGRELAPHPAPPSGRASHPVVRAAGPAGRLAQASRLSPWGASGQESAPPERDGGGSDRLARRPGLRASRIRSARSATGAAIRSPGAGGVRPKLSSAFETCLRQLWTAGGSGMGSGRESAVNQEVYSRLGSTAAIVTANRRENCDAIAGDCSPGLG